MEDRELISIIIPARNAEKTLEGCVMSALAQTYEDIEILLMENGSCDGTAALCERLAAENERVRAFRLDTNGVSAARNAGIRQAKGKYLTFLDADDRIAPDFCRHLYGCLISEHADIAGCRLISREDPPDFASDPDCAQGQGAPLLVFDGERYIKDAFLNGNVRVCTKLIRAELIGEKGFPEDLTIGEDLVFFLEILQKDTRVAVSEEVLYWYYTNAMSAMNRPYVPAYRDQILCWDRAGVLLEEKFPGVMEDPAAEEKLRRIRCIAALLVAIKIARLPAGGRKKYREEMDDAADRIRRLTEEEDITADMTSGQRLRIFLLLHFRSLFVVSCKLG